MTRRALRLDKLEAMLGQASVDMASVAPLFAALLGIDTEGRYPRLDLTPEQQRARTLEALTEQLLGLARARPVLCLFEDVHWVDPTTLELIEQALDAIASSRVLFLLTARPTFQHGLGGHPHVTRLTLNRLGREPTADDHRQGRGRPRAAAGAGRADRGKDRRRAACSSRS